MGNTSSAQPRAQHLHDQCMQILNVSPGVKQVPPHVVPSENYENLEPSAEVKLFLIKNSESEPEIITKKCFIEYGDKTHLETLNCYGERDAISVNPTKEIINVVIEHNGEYIKLDTFRCLMKVIDGKLKIYAHLYIFSDMCPGIGVNFTGVQFVPIENIAWEMGGRPVKNYDVVIKCDENEPDVAKRWKFLRICL
uniref:Uncharacterized protein n=1 Tax=viral metagenome TaxID=1070528 RepID=A0A6C0EC04_9ZZZZ